jgi:hypothetical protein
MSYILHALSESRSKELGTVTVAMDARCQTYTIVSAEHIIEGALSTGVENAKEDHIYFRTPMPNFPKGPIVNLSTSTTRPS